MKKSALILLMIIVTLSSLFAFSACDKDKGTANGKTVTDLLGREVTVPEKINRVVCIGAGSLRLYTYVGDLSKLVGVEDIDGDGKDFNGVLSIRPYKMVNKDLFKSLQSCGKGGPQGSPEAEKILALNPDIVFSLYTSDKAAMDDLQQKIGKPVVVLSYGKTEAFDENVKKSIALLGDILNRKERANELLSFISDTETYLSSIGEGIDKNDKATVYLGCQSNYGTHGIESSSANYSIFDVSKIRNVLDEYVGKTGETFKGYQKSVDWEILVEMNPDRIILDAGGLEHLKTQLKEKPEIFNRLSAFQNGEIYLQMPYNAYYTNLETAYADAYFDAWVQYHDIAPEKLNFDYVEKAREIYTLFLGEDCYDDVAAQMYGGFQTKLDISKIQNLDISKI
jgi:predicted metal ion (Fe 3+) ABC transporter, ATPase component